MRLALILLALPAAAAAEPDRSAAVAIAAGVSGAAQPSAELSAVPFVPMLGLAVAWDRAPSPPDPAAPLPIAISGSIAPEAAVSLHGHRAMALIGTRLQLALGLRDHPFAMTCWLSPRIGAMMGAGSLARGGELGMAFQRHSPWQVGVVYGIYAWREPASFVPRRVTSVPVAPWIVQGQLAVVVRTEL
jgi:hypothetical protein